MFFRKSVPALLALAASMQLVAGCGGLVMDRKEIDATGRIALVSVVVPRVADISKDENRVVLQAAANHARGRVLAGLAAVHGWTVLDPMKERMGKTVQAFGTVAVADLEALFPAAGERKRIAKLFKEERSRWKEEFLAAEDMPVIPREAFAPGDDGTQPDIAAVRQVTLRQAGLLCAALKADAVAFVHLRISITHPRDATFIVINDRTDGMLRMAATMVIVGKTGKIILDRGWPRLDDSARTRDLLPLYRGAGKDFVKKENIDLDDSRKKVSSAFTALTDDAVADLLEALKAAAR